MEKDTKLDVRIGEFTIKSVIVDGHKLLPLTDLMKALYGKAFRKETDAIKPDIQDYIKTIGSKRYITLMALSPILHKYGDKELQELIMCQVLHFFKPKKDPVQVIYDGIVGISNITNLQKQVFDEIHKLELTQSDLLHSLENNELSPKEMAEVARKIKFLRKRRRDFKNKQTMLNMQTTELKNIGFKSSSDAGKAVTNLAKLRAEQETAKKHKIYFNRDGSNEEEMRAKIKEIGA